MLRTAALRACRRVETLALQQQQRYFADKAVAVDMDWDSITALIHSDEGKREVTSLRSAYGDIKQRLETLAKDPTPIDWNTWRKDIDPKLVDGFKNAFDSMKLPEYEGTEVQDAAAQFESLLKEAEALVAHSEQRAKEIQATLQDIARDKERIATATVDEELANDPKLAEEVDREVASKYFMP